MANKIIVTADCVVAAAQLPSRAFTTDEEVQPTSPYYYILLWSGLANDSGIPADGTDESILPMSAVIVQVPRSAGHDYSVRWSASQSRWIIFDQETEVEALVAALAPSVIEDTLRDPSVTTIVTASVAAEAEDAVDARLADAGVLTLRNGLPVLARNLATNPRAALNATGGNSSSVSTFSVTREASITDHPLGITTAYKMTALSGPSGGGAYFSARMGATKAGEITRISVWVKSSVNTRINPRAEYKPDGGTTTGYVNANTVQVPAGVWTRISFTAESPAGSDGHRVVPTFYNNGNYQWPAGATMLLTGLLMSVGEEDFEFFDGDSTGARWEGAAHTTASELVTLRRSDAAPLAAPESHLGSEIIQNLATNPVPRSIFTSGGQGAGFVNHYSPHASVTLGSTSDGPVVDGKRLPYVRKTTTSVGNADYLIWRFTDQNTDMPTGGIIADMLPVQPGRKYRISYYSRITLPPDSPTTLGAQMVIYRFFNYSGATITSGNLQASEGGRTVGATSGVWQRCSVVLTAPEGSGALAIRQAISNSTSVTLAVGGTNDVTGLLIEDVTGFAQVPELPEFFDGETDGAYWTGIPNQSTSILRSPRKIDILQLARNAAGVAQGAGSPEGIVSAPVGFEYVDTAATNGAVKWIKTSGSGSTGWRVVYGDTGIKPLTQWDAAGNVTGLTMSEKFAPRPGIAGGIFYRRRVDVVEILLQNFVAAVDFPTSGEHSLLTLPSGVTGLGVPPNYRVALGHNTTDDSAMALRTDGAMLMIKMRSIGAGSVVAPSMYLSARFTPAPTALWPVGV